MQRNRLLLSAFLICLAMGIWSCHKKDGNPIVPNIEFKSISSVDVVEFDNQIDVVFSYEDFQGDLGNIDPDINTLKVKDSRLVDWDWYHIPPMTPDNKELHIKGDFTLKLRPLFLIGNSTSESTVLTIQILDREGNVSNQIQTPPVTIHQ